LLGLGRERLDKRELTEGNHDQKGKKGARHQCAQSASDSSRRQESKGERREVWPGWSANFTPPCSQEPAARHSMDGILSTMTAATSSSRISRRPRQLWSDYGLYSTAKERDMVVKRTKDVVTSFV
jgi:hypothetical protein